MAITTITRSVPAPLGYKTIKQNQPIYVANKFYMFLHFNMATFQTGVGDDGNPAADINIFNPTALNIDQWIAVALSAKAKAIYWTVKHDDGCCMWPTTSTPRTIANSSWYAANGSPDLVQQFVTKCRAAGISPRFYFCIWDTYFEANFSVTQASYKNYQQALIAELLTRYGPIDALWIDGTDWHFSNGNPGYPWDSANQRNAFIHGLQPNCLVVDNNHISNLVASDIAEFEGGFAGQSIPPGNTMPSELCASIRGDSYWFWKAAVDTPMTAATIVSNINDSNSKNGTFLLNVPPDNTGVIPARYATVMSAVGALLP